MASPPSRVRQHKQGIAVALAARAIGLHLRGAARLTQIAARLVPGLRVAPVALDGAVVFLDLRRPYCTDLLLGARLERAESALMQRLVCGGDVALDVGAYFGLHTIHLSRLVGSTGRVYAFEPSPVVLPCLSRTVGGLDNTALLAVALATKRGSASFVVPSDASMASFADWASLPGAPIHRHQVPVDCIDRLVAEKLVGRPDFVKCDVEGAEALVFQGALSVLDCELAPLVLFEVNPAASTALGLATDAAVSVLQRLRRPAYQIFSIGAKLELVPQGGLPGRLMNVLAVPASRKGLL